MAKVSSFFFCMNLLLFGPLAPERNGPHFVDVTASSRIKFVHQNGFSERKYAAEIMGSGAAWFDYDRDGDIDIFLVNGGKTPASPSAARADHALYRNNGDGTFSDVTRQAGILANHWFGMGAAVGDYNNDGLEDLLVTHFEGYDLLYRNNGDGTFAEVSQEAGVRGSGAWSSSAAFFDYDNDGYLDLYVAHYIDHSFANNLICPMGNPPVKGYCSPKVYKGVPDALYHNNRDGTFTDVSLRAGIAIPDGKGLGVVAGDVNGDGWIDIYIANDQVRNFLFVNNHDGTFAEIGTEAGVAFDENGNAQAGMGTDVADFDNDGLFDIAVSNLDTEYLALYRNLGANRFEDVSARTGLVRASERFVGFGVRFVDFDNDGLLDLFVANGHVLDNPEVVRPGATFKQPKLLLRNSGKGFLDVTASSGTALSAPTVSRGVAFGDFDNDGDVDALVNNCGAAPQLLRNDGGNRNEWLTVELRGTRSNRSGIGTVLEVLTAGRRRVFQAVGGASYMSASDPRIHVGLASVTRVDELTVRWPSGVVDRVTNVRSRQKLIIEEGMRVATRESRVAR